jgi:hypothetical protein
MVTSVSKGVRVAAGIVCAGFAAFVLVHLLWAVGITWGLDEVSGGQADDNELTASLALTAASLAGAAAGALAILVTAARVGWYKTRLSDRLLQLGAWIVFLWPAAGVVNQANLTNRAVALAFAIPALVLALAHPRR